MELDYDKEKYRDMLLEATETVLGYFGFDRTAFSEAPKKKMKWWRHLLEEKLKDRDTETIHISCREAKGITFQWRFWQRPYHRQRHCQ